MQSAVHFQVPVALRHLFEPPASSRLGTNSDRELFWTGNYFGQGTISDTPYFFWDTTPPSTLVNFDRAVERQHH